MNCNIFFSLSFYSSTQCNNYCSTNKYVFGPDLYLKKLNLDKNMTSTLNIYFSFIAQPYTPVCPTAIWNQTLTVRAGSTGNQGSTVTTFIYPHQVAIDTYGNLYVADCNNHRIQKFAPGINLMKFKKKIMKIFLFFKC